MSLALGTLTSLFGKDVVREQALLDMNRLLAPVQASLEADTDAPAFPPVLILGPPRSGTTLASQLLQSTGQFGTVSNFVARFWLAPAVGLQIQAALGFGASPLGSSFQSVRGGAQGWKEPSEFGYFWSRFFDLGQPTHLLGTAERERFDGAGLRRAVTSMEAVAGKPMAFKNNTWFSFHADLLAEIFPGAVLVVCRRDPFFVAQSLYLQRIHLYGDASLWWSMRPPEYEAIRGLPPIEQVAQQAVRIIQHTEASVARAKGVTVVSVNYDRLVAEPRAIIAKIAAAAGVPVSDGELTQLPASFTSTDTVRLDHASARALEAAIASAGIRT
ncbi:MAG: sulfotransferase [Alphaproteobacteria bacterium]